MIIWEMGPLTGCFTLRNNVDKILRGCVEKSEHSRPDATIFTKACLTGWPLDGVWAFEWGAASGDGPAVLRRDMSGSLCLTICTVSVVYAGHLLSFWKSRKLVYAEQGVPPEKS